MLNLNDIIALAKQGYKPADVKELIELSKTVEAEAPSEDQTQPTNNDQSVAPEDVPEDKPEEEQKDGDSSEKIVDYKKKSEELEAKLAQLQKANTKQNADKSDKKSDAELFADVMKSFM